MNIDNLYQKLKNIRFSIYGTGYVAKKFFLYLSSTGLTKNLSYFIVTKKQDATDFHGIGIKSIKEIEENSNQLVCIAVHESLLNEIVKELEGKGIDNYIWIYPYLLNLITGNPIIRNKTEDVKAIIKNNLSDYRIAVRYLAIQYYYRENNVGASIYKKAMALHCEESTVEERLRRFYSLIKNWESNGYNKEIPILITEKNNIIDGHHRIALARYFKQKDITCDIYPEKFNTYSFHGEKAMLTEDILSKANLTMEEIELLEHVNRKLGSE